MAITDANSRETIRKLARQIADFAASQENAIRRRRWADVNGLKKTDRPPVICNLSQAWNEVLPRSVIVSTDPWLADVEYELRRVLCKIEIGDDTIFESMPVGYVVKCQNEHTWGLPVECIRANGVQTDASNAWKYESPLKEESDIHRIIAPKYIFDQQATSLAVERMNDLLGDILPVTVVCGVLGAGPWLHGWAVQLRGFEQLFIDMFDRPQWVHRLMRTLMEGVLGVMDQVEKEGLLSLNNTGMNACDDLPADGFDPKHVRLKDLWVRGESQEFQSVGPAQYQEFLLQYQIPIMERFGLTYYGCCEDLTNKIDLVLSIPNLRRFVCSAWTDIEKLAAALGSRYCIEWRQKATDVVFASDLAATKAHLQRGLTIARGHPIMIVLQELETVNNNPRRLSEWTVLAKEVGARCAG